MKANRKLRRNVKRILVLYEDPGFEQTVRRIGESAGDDVITAPCSGPVTMDVFHNTKPGLVVLDVCRPGKSHPNPCRQIRGISVLDRFLPEFSKNTIARQIRQEQVFSGSVPGPAPNLRLPLPVRGHFFGMTLRAVASY